MLPSISQDTTSMTILPDSHLLFSSLPFCLLLAIPEVPLPLFSTWKIPTYPSYSPGRWCLSPSRPLSHSLSSQTMLGHSTGHLHHPSLSPCDLLHFLDMPQGQGCPGMQLPTCELLERGVGLHAKPLSVFIEGLYAHLSGLFDDIHGHM